MGLTGGNIKKSTLDTMLYFVQQSDTVFSFIEMI